MAKTQGAVSFYLKDPKATKNTPVRATFCYNNMQLKYYEPKLSIHPKFWNINEQKAREIKGFPSASFNATLKAIGNTIIEVYQTYKLNNDNLEPSLAQLREKIKIARNTIGSSQERIKLDFFGFLDTYLKEVHKKVNPVTGKQLSSITIRAYKQTHRVLKEYVKATNKVIDFEHIDIDFYNDFTYFLTHTKMYRLNTVGKHLRNVKTFMQEALDRNLTTNIHFRKRTFRVVSEKTDSIYLNEHELKELEELDLSDDKRLERVRDLFLVGCWTGLRFSDFSKIQLHNIQQDFIEIETQKTGAKVYIPIHSVVRKILEKYNQYPNSLPPSISNQKMNEYLKEIGEKVETLKQGFTIGNTIKGTKVHQTYCKYQLLVTHTARRTFATNQYLKGIPAYDIMKITGHKTEKAFLRYLKLNNKDAAMRLDAFWKGETKLIAI